MTAPVPLARVRYLASAPLRISPPPLRTAGSHHRDDRRASWLELFFDLVFAGAVGQLGGTLQDHPDLGTLTRFVLLFTPIWWLWVQFSFYADRHESDDAVYRGAILTAILLCAGLAACAPRALAGDTTGFVVAFACLRGLQLLLYARARWTLPATRRLYTGYLIFFGAGGALWLSSLAVGGLVRYAFWGAALACDAAGALTMLEPSRRVAVNPAHLTDRFQLFVLIVLGESVARLISAAAARPWTVPLAVVLGTALLTLAALWWAWLTAVGPAALGTPEAVASFTALNLPMVTGIASVSAGLHIAILAAQGGGPIGAGPRAALYGGVSLFLLASALLPSRGLSRRARWARLVTGLAAMGLVFMGTIVVPVYLVPALAGVLVVGLAAEARKSGHGALAAPPDVRPTHLHGADWVTWTWPAVRSTGSLRWRSPPTAAWSGPRTGCCSTTSTRAQRGCCSAAPKPRRPASARRTSRPAPAAGCWPWPGRARAQPPCPTTGCSPGGRESWWRCGPGRTRPGTPRPRKPPHS
jgi:low temperature requirement protein LtrA